MDDWIKTTSSLKILVFDIIINLNLCIRYSTCGNYFSLFSNNLVLYMA
ncbi:hypothetical protein [Methanohalophilus sp.]